MIVAVTGAGGHIGANLVRALLRAGDEVRALDIRRGAALEDLDLSFVVGDVLDPPSLLRSVMSRWYSIWPRSSP
jgi:dihydroflavonol-4-reductase